MGRGSTFHFTVMLQEDPSPPRTPALPAASAQTLQDLAVLVVDDNATNRRVFEELTRNWGMRPLLAKSGTQALEMLRSGHEGVTALRLLLLDYQMPGMNGLELATRIREENLAPAAAVVLLTSVGHPCDAATCRRLGIAQRLTKPVSPLELLEAALQALETATTGRT